MVHVKLKQIARCGIVAALLALTMAVATGCQQEPTAPAESDTNLMQEAVSGGKEPVSPIDTPFYVLVIGNDARVGTTEASQEMYADGKGRSDTMMLVRVDPKTYQVALVTIPRDTETTIDGGVAKINEAYHYGGIDMAVDQVEDLTGVKVQYYLDMRFIDFEKFVNELGGITANVPIDMHLKDIVSGDTIELGAGTQELNGPEALVLARVRKLYAADIEACRQIQDRQIVEVGIKQVAADPANAAAHVDTLMANVNTNWPAEELAAMVADFAANADRISFQSGTGPYVGDFMEEHDGLWMTPRDEDTWRKVIEVVEAGGDPTTVVPLPEVEAA